MRRSTLQARLNTLSRTFVVLASIVTGVLICGCGAPSEPAPVQNVHNPTLNLSIADLPAAWKVRSNDDDRLELVPSGADGSGAVRVTVGPEEKGINLVAAVDDHRAEIESREGGVYAGAQELSGPLGAAFYTRGRYDDNGTTIEETRILALHPSGNRLLILEYTYPAGDDSSSRVSELIELFALVE